MELSIKALNIISKLHKNGFSAFVVGGAVRDHHREVSPKDFDIATDARAHNLVKIFPDAKIVGESYEVVLVDGIEIAPFRTDFDHDGRHASVSFVSTIEEDLARRDFTMNAMAFHPNGGIIDPFNGRKDIFLGVIRFVGDANKRMEEDLLRGVRALRFAADFGFSLDANAREAISSRAERIVNEISPERFRLEFEKVKHIGPFIKSLFALGLGKFLLPEVHDLKGVKQHEDFHPEGDAFVHTMLTLEFVPTNASFELKMAALLHDIGKAIDTKMEDDGKLHAFGHEDSGATLAEVVMRRFKTSTDSMERVVNLVQHHMQLHHESTTKRTVRRLRNKHGKDFLRELVQLTWADSLAGAGLRPADMKNFGLVNEAVHESAPEKVESVLNGKELMELLNLKPGKEVGLVKNALLEHQFDHDHLMTKEEATEFVLAFAKENIK